MPRRKRKKIKTADLAAAALAALLPAETRDALRAAKVPAAQVLRLFTPDHIVLHAWGGSDAWWNLDMRRRGPDLKLKDARDTSRAAKVVRIEEKWGPFTRAMAKGKKRKPAKRRSRPLQSRGFPERSKRHGLTRRY